MNSPPLKGETKGGLTYLYRAVDGKPSASIVMLHGLGGNETSMWAFENAVPNDAFVVTPRALFPLGAESYSWVPPRSSGWANLEDFRPSVQAIEKMLEGLEHESQVDRNRLILMGFSQGAALAFALANQSDLKPIAMIVASGFIPKGDLTGLRDISVFWGHGSHDEWIPIARAKRQAKRLTDMGLSVNFCETDVGHKLGLECLEGLRKWLKTKINSL